jgi:hypothetical protein
MARGKKYLRAEIKKQMKHASVSITEVSFSTAPLHRNITAHQSAASRCHCCRFLL